MKRHIAILGSTGSIGKQALEVIDTHPEVFDLELITAFNNADLLIRQAMKYVPNVVVIANELKYTQVADALEKYPIKVYAGENAMVQVMEMNTIHVVLNALVGYSGLLPTIEAIKSGKHVALANKECLVIAGEIITRIAKEKHVNLIPVDSEHSAIFQCLVGEQTNPVEKIILTASGGPFREKSLSELENVTRRQALKHPCWNMGSKITIDSASLMNKGLEVIEAKWLFDLAPSQIDVIIHPQSIIHSMVQFEDGSIKAQMGLPDMRLPIQYALSFPFRLPSDFPRFQFTDYRNLTFEPPDTKKFRNLAIAFEAMKLGGNMPCAMNAANEIMVEAFLKEKISFLKMPEIIEQTMQTISFIKTPSLDDYIETNEESRKIAGSLLSGC